MTASAPATVTLISPNGAQVTVAASKKDERLRGGYRLAEKQTPRSRTSRK